MSPPLPDKPLIRIRPARRWKILDLSELWEHHELFYFLVWRDLKTRYKQTILGAGWVVLQPLLMTLVFTIFLGKLVAVPTNGVPYSIFAYSGLLPWIFFSNAILSSSHSLINNAPLITKLYFPRIFLPAAAVIVRLADLCVAATILFALLFYYGFAPSWKMLLFLPLVPELTLLALACGLWSAALNVKYRDIGTLLPVVLQLWMFTSPIIYASNVVPEKWRALYLLNPLAGIVEGIHASLFNLNFDWISIGFSAVVTLLLLLFSIYSFQIADESFADVV
ncbi:MAG TPA: ABC transporter permease [Pyrinomonadaceae bacterium]|nr:ABC transporter permease [Pyrinomonadaceae bacterium]